MIDSDITLPEINVSDQLDWDDISFLSSSPPPAPPPHSSQQEVPVLTEKPENIKNENNEGKTTGLTRALSLPRQLNKEEDDIRKEVINIATANPSHLFWVPASQHPEIAPTEYEKYVDSHGLMIRRKSAKRRQSILSVYFTANDQKFLDDLGRQSALDSLEKGSTDKTDDCDEEEEEGEKRKRKMVLRRSVSLHLPSAGDYARNVPDLLVFDRNSSPFDESRALVPKGDRPLLRRGARTNFKRNSSITVSTRPQLVNGKSETDYHQRNSLPMTRSNSAVTYDGAGVVLTDDTKVVELEEQKEPKLLSPVMESNEEVRDLLIASREPPMITRSVSTSTSNSSGSRGRKSAWSWSSFWSDENKLSSSPSLSKKNSNKIEPTSLLEVESPPPQPQVSKSTDTSSKRFTLSSLFSRKSKNTNNSANTYSTSLELLQDDNKSNAPKDFQLNKMYMTRLPLHVERAVYKLSHVKLANPRRPLHEQVLISNQMFWYLSVIASNSPNLHPVPVQQRKKPRKLVKKQPPPQKKTEPNSFMAKSSTGFIVPENYLNPNNKKKQMYHNKAKEQQHKAHHTQSSDSSSSDEDDPQEDEDEEVDDIPLALYKSNSRQSNKTK